MFLPKVKKSLTGLTSMKRIKNVIAGVVIASGLAVGVVSTDANAAQIQGATYFHQTQTTGALLLTPSDSSSVNLARGHSSHSSHASHASHASSRY
jgi:hypothetical protein